MTKIKNFIFYFALLITCSLLGLSLAYEYDIGLLLLIGIPAIPLIFSMTTLTIIHIAVFLSLFSRIFVLFGLPGLLNYIHFLIILLAFIKVILEQQLHKPLFSDKIFRSLIAFLVLTLVSALYNESDLIRPIITWLLFCEPFILLFVVLYIPISNKQLKNYLQFLILIGIIQIPLASIQFFENGIGDSVQGSLIGQGAGAHILGAMVLVFSICVINLNIIKSLISRILFTVMLISVSVLADAKQVIGVFVISFLILLFINSKKHRVRFSFAFIVIISTLHIASLYYKPINMILDSNLLSKGLNQKFSIFPTVISEYRSPFDYMVGVGPGTTVSRVALMTINEYARENSPLVRLGIYESPLTKKIWNNIIHNFYSRSSSAWAPVSSWFGIWGDLGILGVFAYFYFIIILWRKANNLSRKSTITVQIILVFLIFLGGVSSYLEEPALVLYAFSWLGYIFKSETKKQKGYNNNFENN